MDSNHNLVSSAGMLSPISSHEVGSFQVRRIPFELWARIFLYATSQFEADHDYGTAWWPSLTFSHVCEWWRLICIAVPHLWCTLDIQISTSLSALFLQRSQLRPLNVYLQSPIALRDGFVSTAPTVIPPLFLSKTVVDRVHKLASSSTPSSSVALTHLQEIRMPLPYTALSHLSLHCSINSQPSYFTGLLEFLEHNPSLEVFDFLGGDIYLLPEDYVWNRGRILLRSLRYISIKTMRAESRFIQAMMENISFQAQTVVHLEAQELFSVLHDGILSLLPAKVASYQSFLDALHVLQFNQPNELGFSVLGGNDVAAFELAVSVKAFSVGDVLSSTLSAIGKRLRCVEVRELWFGPAVSDSEWIWHSEQREIWEHVLRHFPSLETLSFPLGDLSDAEDFLSALTGAENSGFPCPRLSTLHVFALLSTCPLELTPLLKFVRDCTQRGIALNHLHFHTIDDLQNHPTISQIEQHVTEVTYDSNLEFPRDFLAARRLEITHVHPFDI
ncbi:uncharacterized protein STEHIDRAFT_112659 [Stereum hirsutum FP-91666 SS1]|uniref:uncharacterized protein n=1 Tax=Stereum hirsutum (strain FP-91666) TaxID=721885 RepID=UPI000444A54F|nr:uncharacterized protein STEHIDRAFT_112659 [Stereum hirsutum FP-91666 SS1]EIM84221.1 hypothetical protein STEHIDRAFT_112659 [Stereum hirsutum FP-91666 SS1]